MSNKQEQDCEICKNKYKDIDFIRPCPKHDKSILDKSLTFGSPFNTMGSHNVSGSCIVNIPKNDLSSFIKITFNTTLPTAKLPTRSKESDAGFDIYSPNDVTLKSNQVTMLETGINVAKWEIKDNNTNQHFFLKVEGRSGLASKGIFPVGGIGDQSYTGEYKVILANLSGADYQIKTGDRIAQFVIHSLPTVVLELDNSVEKMQTERGSNGIGSTGN